MNVTSLPTPVAFVLTGGASNGAAHAGMLRATAEVHLKPDLVTGTSVGALNGAVLAERPDLGPARLLEIWAGLSTSDVFTDGLATRIANLVRSRRYLYSGRGLRKLVSGHLRAEEFSDLAIPFAAVATDVFGGHEVVLRTGPLVQAIAASAAIPGVLPNVEIGGRLLMDGGVVANAPVHAAIEMGARSIVLLDAGYACHLTEPPRHIAARVLHATSVMIRRQVERDVDEVAKTVPVVVLPPLCPLRSSPLDFDHGPELIEEAYRTSREFLRDLTVDGLGLYGELHRHEPPAAPHQPAAADG
jgi:NTE family protein